MTESLLKPGDLVYKVIDCGDDFPSVCSVKIQSASVTLIRLARPFPFVFGTNFNAASLGTIFSRSAVGAIELHRVLMERDRESAKRDIARADLEIAWCDAQRAKIAKVKP